jgi:hypothetical protein
MTSAFDRSARLLACAALVAFSWCVLPSLGGLAAFAGLAVVFTAPGWPLARWFAGQHSDPMIRSLLALAFGYGAGTGVCCVLRLAGVSAPLGVLAAS